MSTPKPTNANSTPNLEAPASPAQAPPKHRRGRKRNPDRHAERPSVPLMLTVPEAAETLRTTVEALRHGFVDTRLSAPTAASPRRSGRAS